MFLPQIFFQNAQIPWDGLEILQHEWLLLEKKLNYKYTWLSLQKHPWKENSIDSLFDANDG